MSDIGIRTGVKFGYLPLLLWARPAHGYTVKSMLADSMIA